MATLTTTITENVILNGAPRGSSNTVTITEIEQVAEQIIQCPAGEKTGAETIIGNWASVVNAAKYHSFDYDNSKYVRVTNLDQDIALQVAFVSNGLACQPCSGEEPAESADSCRFLLGPGQSAVMWTTTKGKLGEGTEPKWTAALTDLSYISIWNPTTGETAKPLTIELFVAGTEN